MERSTLGQDISNEDDEDNNEQVDEDEDMEDILNYENSEEIKKYQKDLREKYMLDYESSDTSDEFTDKSSMKKCSSFSSLMNILSAMRKSRLSQSVSVCKLNLLNANIPLRTTIKDDINELPSNKDLKTSYEQNATSLNYDAEARQNSLKEELLNIKEIRAKQVFI